MVDYTRIMTNNYAIIGLEKPLCREVYFHYTHTLYETFLSMTNLNYHSMYFIQYRELFHLVILLSTMQVKAPLTTLEKVHDLTLYTTNSGVRFFAMHCIFTVRVENTAFCAVDFGNLEKSYRNQGTNSLSLKRYEYSWLTPFLRFEKYF